MNHKSSHIRMRKLRHRAFRVCPRLPCFSAAPGNIRERDGNLIETLLVKNEVKNDLEGEAIKTEVSGVHRSSLLIGELSF